MKRLFQSYRRKAGKVRMAATAIGMLLTVLAGYLAFQRWGGGLVNLSYDLPFIAHRADTDENIAIVYVDEMDGGSLDRRNHAKLLDALGKEKVKAVIYDIVFDRSAEDPAVDEEFAAALRRFRGVDAGGNEIPDAHHGIVMLACGRETLHYSGAAGEKLLTPIDSLLDAVDGEFGVVTVEHDARYVVRRLSTGTRDEPSVTWKLAKALGAPLPGDEEERMKKRWINFAGPPVSTGTGLTPAIPAYGQQSVIAGDLRGLDANSIVIVGGRPGIAGWAAGTDLFATPFHALDHSGKMPLMSGVELQANLLSNLMRGNWLTRSSPGFERWMIVVGGLVAGLLLAWIRPGLSAAAAVVAIGALAVCGVLTVHFGGWWFPWAVVAFVQVPVAYVWGTTSSYCVEAFLRSRGDKLQQKFNQALSRYVSPEMSEKLQRDDFSIELGGETLGVVMLVTDLESYSSMCESVDNPGGVVTALNDYFSRTAGPVYAHKGAIIQFTGDSIFAAWGTPLSKMAESEAVKNAVTATWELTRGDKVSVEGFSMRTRCGLHFGQVVAGHIGNDEHIAYALVGDAANLAHRLEGLNKMLETDMLLSGEVYRKMDSTYRTRRVGRFKMKGRTKTTEVYELVGTVAQIGEPEWITLYHQAIAALEAGDRETAEKTFATVERLRGKHGDGPSRFFLKLLSADDPLSDGVVELKEK